ncbi:MAG: hypothetical protein HY548_04035, partial [Elusimicrobia bacterium]|nr:hypothetical protein [Elusimicrobiota bacterium]
MAPLGFGALALFILASSLSAATTFTVRVSGSGCASGAQVMAVSHGNQGPDPAKTRVTTANSAGVATFADLTDGSQYQFAATNSGCSPSLRDQMMDYNNFPTDVTSGGSKDIALTSGGTGATAVVNLILPAGGFPKLVMGGCRLGMNNEDVGFGMASITAANGESITFYNLPPAEANTYNCGVFSPSDNRGGGLMVDVALTAGQSTTLANAINLNTSYAPPSAVEDQASRDGLRSGEGSPPNLAVVVTRQDTGNPVRGAQLKLKTTTSGGPQFFSMTDPYGVGSFYGLMNSTTYYLDIFSPGLEGVVSRAFYSTDWIAQSQSTSIALSTSTGGGAIVGTVNLNGVAVPNVWINVRPDFQGWAGADTYGGNSPNPGSGFYGGNSSTGAINVTNLPAGNYELEVGSPFSNQPTQYNVGADGQRNTSDDIRLTISSTSVFLTYSSSGTLLSSGTAITVTMKVDTTTANGSITGSLVFPESVNLAAEPIVIVAHEEFGNTPGQQPKAGFAVVNGTGQTQTYTVSVPAGVKYYVEFRGSGYGPIDLMNNFADLTSQTSVALPAVKFVRAGTVNVKVFGPNGSRWLPKTMPEPGDNFTSPGDFDKNFCGGNLNADGLSVRAWSWGQIDQNGEATLQGVPEGMYTLRFGTWGQGCSVADTRLDGVLVTAGTTTVVNMNLKKGIPMQATHSGTLPTELKPHPLRWEPGTEITMEGNLLGFPKGVAYNFDMLRRFHGRSGDVAPISFKYKTIRTRTGQEAVVWTSMMGWDSAPKVAPGEYNFLILAEGRPGAPPLGRERDPSYDPGHMYFRVLGSTTSLVDTSKQTTVSTIYGSTVVAVTVPVNYKTDGGKVSGQFKGTRVFTKEDINNMGGDFDKFLGYVPMCALYD